MVTFAQAQERAEEWINGDVPSYQHREVRVREFELGFVIWAEDRADGPRSDGGAQRMVLARDSGEATLWPALPVGEVVRRYEEEYGRSDEIVDAVPAAPARVDLNQTSFLLSPPEWLQEAADKLGIPDRRGSRPRLRLLVRVSGCRVRRGVRSRRRRPGCPPLRRGPTPAGPGCRTTRPPCLPGRLPGRGPTPTRIPARTVRYRCPRPCSRRRCGSPRTTPRPTPRPR